MSYPFYLSVGIISRRKGHSSTAKSSYNNGTILVDERRGIVFDFRRKRGVLRTGIICPPGTEWASDRGRLWNTAEARELRWDSRVAREIKLSLPHRLTRDQNWDLLQEFGAWLVENLHTPVDLAMHGAPWGGDPRNIHAHGLMPTRVATGVGLGKKLRALDSKFTSGAWVELARSTWAKTVNRALERAGFKERCDHRSYKRQGLSLKGGRHLGRNRWWSLKKVRRELAKIDAQLSALAIPTKAQFVPISAAEAESAEIELSTWFNARAGKSDPPSDPKAFYTDGDGSVLPLAEFLKRLSDSIASLGTRRKMEPKNDDIRHHHDSLTNLLMLIEQARTLNETWDEDRDRGRDDKNRN